MYNKIVTNVWERVELINGRVSIQNINDGGEVYVKLMDTETAPNENDIGAIISPKEIATYTDDGNFIYIRSSKNYNLNVVIW